MPISEAVHEGRLVVLRWVDGTEATFPCLWLRDNDTSAFHPNTRERIFDLLSVASDITPSSVRIDEAGQNLVLRWPDLDQESMYAADWLKAHQPGQALTDPAVISPVLWNAQNLFDIPHHNASGILADPAAMLVFLKDTMSYGITIVEGLENSETAGLDVGHLIGPMRNSNFGTIFDVISKPDPNNLAYTAGFLPLHTDLPNQETPPAYQFLHCIVNSANGGESLYCDGFHIAEELRQNDPGAFDLLTKVAIPFRFHDESTDIRCHRPVIALDNTDAVSVVAWNAHLAAGFDMTTDVINNYYEAYRTFMAMVRDERQVVSLKLQAGEMVVFDNRRVLHGRAEFFPNTGDRHLKGYYIDRVDMMSRIRELSA
jgi:gamma-butyrobetaine dioxygenase